MKWHYYLHECTYHEQSAAHKLTIRKNTTAHNITCLDNDTVNCNWNIKLNMSIIVDQRLRQ